MYTVDYLNPNIIQTFSYPEASPIVYEYRYLDDGMLAMLWYLRGIWVFHFGKTAAYS